jgi:hypothetical protein
MRRFPSPADSSADSRRSTTAFRPYSFSGTRKDAGASRRPSGNGGTEPVRVYSPAASRRSARTPAAD